MGRRDTATREDADCMAGLVVMQSHLAMGKSRLACVLVLLILSAIRGAKAQSSSRPGAVVTWSSSAFSVGLDEHGLITAIYQPDDPNHMDWVRPTGPAWGLPVSREQGKLITWEMPVIASSGHDANELRFRHGGLTLTLDQALTSNNQLVQSYSLTNSSGMAVKFAEGDFGIRIPLPDNYPSAATALVRRCDVHLWMGGSTAWIEAIRMGGQPPNLGLVLRQGSLSAYAITARPWNSNDRGTFVLIPPRMTLAPGESMKLSWSLFWNKGWDDFFVTALRSPRFIRLRAERYTVFPGQPLRISAESATPLTGAKLTVNGQLLTPRIDGNHLDAEFTPSKLGEQDFELSAGGRSTRLDAFLSPKPLDLIEARVRFIIEHQQQNAPGQPTDGAFLPFDNSTQQPVISKTDDHNAGRERVGMGVLLALYLPCCADAPLRSRIVDSLSRYWKFVTGRLQDGAGNVFDGPGDPHQRLYNYPWVAQFHLAMYEATKDPRYLDAFTRTIRAFYANGGRRFYPIGLPIREGLAALAQAHRTADHDELLDLFRDHADRILATGTAMPRSEVNYEESIVAPACQILLETCQVSGQRRYRDGAAPFLKALFAFNGEQPDYHLNDVSIRHWDDYWFGKARLYGDTFPHYWSTLTAVVLDDLARTDPADAAPLRQRALNIVANNFCLFTPEGAASCAYVYPLSVNGHPGQFYDPWANDQDWALVNYLVIAGDNSRLGPD